MPREAVPTVEQLNLEYVDLDTLMAWPTNPKEHDLGAIAASMQRFGMRDPIGVNINNNEIEEGHGRRDTLAALKRQGRTAPRFVIVDGDRWLIPVLWFNDDPLAQHGYTLAHNRTHDLGGGYDEQKLKAALEEQAAHGQLTGTGYESADIDALRRKIEGVSNPPTLTTQSKFEILIRCADEEQQRDLLQRLIDEGVECRALLS